MATREKWRISGKTRKFGGKTFRFIKWYFSKMAAEVAEGVLKRKGYLTRVTVRQKGFTGSPNYYLWARKK